MAVRRNSAAQSGPRPHQEPSLRRSIRLLEVDGPSCRFPFVGRWSDSVAFPMRLLWLQLELLEFRCRRAVVAEMVNSRAGRREGERRKWLGGHLVKVNLGGEAGGDMRHVVLTRMFRHKHFDVFNELLADDGTIGRR